MHGCIIHVSSRTKIPMGGPCDWATPVAVEGVGSWVYRCLIDDGVAVGMAGEGERA